MLLLVRSRCKSQSPIFFISLFVLTYHQLLQIAFYGLGLNSSTILTTIGFGSSTTKTALGAYTTLHNVCVGNIILAIAGLIPGYYATFLLVDSWGRKPIQLMGFVLLTIIFVCMVSILFHFPPFTYFCTSSLTCFGNQGFGYDAMQATSKGKAAFVFLYCLANFFQNFGPNTTTFIIPGEVFPTRYRSTAHGMSAASGKLGAVIAQVGFARLINIGGKNAFLKHMCVYSFLLLESDAD